MCFQTASKHLHYSSSIFVLFLFRSLENVNAQIVNDRLTAQSWVLDQHPGLALQQPSVVWAAQLDVLWYQSASFVKTALCYSCRSCLTLYTHTLRIVMNVTDAVWCVEMGFSLCGRLLTDSQISICLSVRPEPPTSVQFCVSWPYWGAEHLTHTGWIVALVTVDLVWTISGWTMVFFFFFFLFIYRDNAHWLTAL